MIQETLLSIASAQSNWFANFKQSIYTRTGANLERIRNT